MLSSQPRGNADACAFSVGHRIDYFAAAIGAVSTGEEFRDGGLAGGSVDHDTAAL
jgi:hypothetical protein